MQQSSRERIFLLGEREHRRGKGRGETGLWDRISRREERGRERKRWEVVRALIKG